MIDLAITRIPAEITEGSLSISPTNPLLTDLIAYYRFNGNGDDSSGNGRNLTINSGFTIPGKVNGALQEGIAQAVGLSIPTSTNITISFWTKIGADAGESLSAASLLLLGGDGIIGVDIPSLNGDLLAIRYSYLVGEAEDSIGPNVTGITEASWRHVVVKTGENFFIYVDGIEVYNDNSLPIITEIDTIWLTTIQNYSDTKIGDVGIWNRALSEAEILQLYNSGNGLDPTA